MRRRLDALNWGVASVTLVSLAARLFDLGARVFAFDESWVGYWTLTAAETGTWEYRPILHGPFLFRANAVSFGLLGPNDVSARLAVALLGGVLPLSALLFRERLDRAEVAALAAILAFNPILLYYSRFMRNDVPLAAFSVFTLGFLVRLADTGRARYLYAAAVTGALAFTTKESALLYLLAGAGGGLLLLDHRLFLVPRSAGTDAGGSADVVESTDAESATVDEADSEDPADGGSDDGDRTDEGDDDGHRTDGGSDAGDAPGDGDGAVAPTGGGTATPSDADRGVDDHPPGRPRGPGRADPWVDWLAGAVASAADRLRGGWRRGAVALALFLGVVVFFYAPRSADPTEPGLYNALVRPGLVPAVVGEATLGSWNALAEVWVGSRVQSHPYLPYFTDTLDTLKAGAPGVVMLSVVGFVLDRYGGDRPRDVVALGFYVGAANVVGYPLVNHFPVPWSTVHAVVPLAFPAAVGAAAVYRWARRARDRGELVPVAVAVLVLAGFGVSAVGTAVETSYRNPQDSPKGFHHGSELVYYNQPPPGLDRGLPVLREATRRTEGTDVLYFGEKYARKPGTDPRSPPFPPGTYARLPLPWYTAAWDAKVESTTNESRLYADPPPVVITSRAFNETVQEALPGYGSATYRLDDAGARQAVVFVDGDLLRVIEGGSNGSDRGRIPRTGGATVPVGDGGDRRWWMTATTGGGG